MKTLAEYMAMRYPLVVEPDGEDGWVAAFPDLPGIISNSADLEDAIKGAQELREAWTEECLRQGRPVPEPGELDSCSGTLTLRIPVSLHRRLKLKAKQEGVSLNQYAAYRLSQAG